MRPLIDREMEDDNVEVVTVTGNTISVAGQTFAHPALLEKGSGSVTIICASL